MTFATARVMGAAAIGLLLTGCATGAAQQAGTSTASSSASRTSQTTSSSSSSTTSASAQPTTSTPSRTASSSAHTTPARELSCANASLRASTAKVEGAAGSRYLTIRLTNAGTQTCRMVGYPGVSIVASNRTTQVGAAADRDTSVRPVPVVLRSGASTTFVLRVTQAANYPATTCRPEKGYGYRIYPPDSRTALLLADPDVTGCANASVHLMTVRPVGAAA